MLFRVSCCVLGCVSWVVVGCSRVVKLIGTPPCAALSFALPPPWLLDGLCCRGIGWSWSCCRGVG